MNNIFTGDKMEKAKETAIPKSVLLREISKDLSTSMTVKDAKLIMEKLGIADRYIWKPNKLGNLQAFTK